MEFNAFQMMNQTHEHECHILTQQIAKTQNNNKRTRYGCEKLKEDKNKILNQLKIATKHI